MRVSRLLQPQEVPDPDRVPLLRTVAWLAFAVVVLVGLGLYFRFGHQMAALL